MESVTGNLANLSLEEIQSKVDEMLLENQELKGIFVCVLLKTLLIFMIS